MKNIRKGDNVTIQLLNKKEGGYNDPFDAIIIKIRKNLGFFSSLMPSEARRTIFYQRLDNGMMNLCYEKFIIKILPQEPHSAPEIKSRIGTQRL